MKILFKLVLLLLILTVLPLGLFGIIAQNDLLSIQESAIGSLDAVAGMAIQDSSASLDDMGKEMIRLVARDVARELEIYIRAHPGMTVEDLQSDLYFRDLAVQPVGKTGYTAIADTMTLVNRFHANPAIVDMDLHSLSEKLPGFWSVMSRTEGGNTAEGTYDWEEADGSIRQKYMFIQPVDAATADGVIFNVAATTYLDEFNGPAKDLSAKMAASLGSVKQEMASGSESMRSRNLLFLILVVVCVILAGVLFAHSITSPLKELSEAGKRVADGNLDAELPRISSSDEIRDIGETMDMLVGAVKYLKSEKKKK